MIKTQLHLPLFTLLLFLVGFVCPVTMQNMHESNFSKGVFASHMGTAICCSDSRRDQVFDVNEITFVAKTELTEPLFKDYLNTASDRGRELPRQWTSVYATPREGPRIFPERPFVQRE